MILPQYCRVELSRIIVNQRAGKIEKKYLREAVAPYRFFDPRRERVCLLKYHWHDARVIAHAFSIAVSLRSRINEVYNYERIITTEWRFAQGDNHTLQRVVRDQKLPRQNTSSRNIGNFGFFEINSFYLLLSVFRINFSYLFYKVNRFITLKYKYIKIKNMQSAL